jgi:hypothetical protein
MTARFATMAVFAAPAQVPKRHSPQPPAGATIRVLHTQTPALPQHGAAVHK